MSTTTPSRRYESRFRCHAAMVTIATGNVYAQTNTQWSLTSASNASKVAINVPSSGYAFLRSHSATIGGTPYTFYFVGLCRSGYTPTNPASGVSWDDTTWGRVPNNIHWYTHAGTTHGYAGASGIYNLKELLGYRYLLGIGFWHPVNVKNNSSKSVTVEYRALDYFFIGSGSGVMSFNFTGWYEITISAGDTTALNGCEPMEIRFSPNAIGNNHAYSVTDQYGSTRRIENTSADYILKTSDKSIIDTPISSDLLESDDGPIIIDDYIQEVWTEGDNLLFADIGGSPGSLLHGTLGVGSNKLLHEAVVTEEDTPLPDEPGDQSHEDGYIEGFAVIVISWSGGEDIDCCAYWTDVTANKLGWSYSSGSTVNPSWMAEWTGDDTGGGPEYIHLGTTAATIASGVTTKTYRVHLNFFREVSGSPTATVTVKFNGTIESGTITPSTNSYTKATTSDAYVTITFNADGTPASVL